VFVECGCTLGQSLQLGGIALERVFASSRGSCSGHGNLGCMVSY
jgi:hypothetical protein